MDLLSDKDREFLKAVKQETDSREKYSRDSREKTNYEPFEEEPIKAHRFKKFVHYLKRGLLALSFSLLHEYIFKGIPFPQPVELTRLEWEKELEEFQNVLPSELRYILYLVCEQNLYKCIKVVAPWSSFSTQAAR